MEIIDNTALRQVVNLNGTVAVVRVTGTKVDARGTRSERVTHKARVLQPIYGELGKTVEIWYRTVDGAEQLKQDCEYAVALGQHPQHKPAWILRGFAPVAPDSIDAAVEAHRRALAELTRQ